MYDQLKTYFGYDEFRTNQRDIVESVLAGRDSLVLMPTGSGKSLCFQLPSVLMEGVTLVISPLIALMKDQVDALNASGIQAACLNSSMSLDEQREVRGDACRGDLDILYVAPERLAMPEFEIFVKKLKISLIAIDEAHCISEWGHDFRPDYRTLSTLREKFFGVPVIALTATATDVVRKDILQQLKMPGAEVFTSSFDRKNLHYSIRPKRQAFAQLVHELRGRKGEAVIVYCFSRNETEKIAGDLKKEGFPAAAYHAGLRSDKRARVQEQFIRDEVPIIVATIAFGMGINKPDVRLVVHMNVPRTMEAYYQETGRAGRDGLTSKCVLFYSFADRRKHEFFIDQIETPKDRGLAKEKLNQVVAYCDAVVCRRRALLGYFGEVYTEDSCDACDICDGEPEELHDATEISQKILSAVFRTGEQFGAGYVCDVLRGSKKQRVLDNGHTELSVYGIVKNIPQSDLHDYIRDLLRKGYLEKVGDSYPVLALAGKGKRALRDREEILLAKPAPQLVRVKKKKRFTNLEFDEALFEQLRELRKEIAEEQGVPPYIVFGDKTLQEMAHYLPGNEGEMRKVFGVGDRKLEAYGSQFLDLIFRFTSG